MTTTYRPAIDGLRAVAVLSVFVFHLNNHWLPGGFLGVDVFFVISGYLITSIILKDCDRGNFRLSVFYQRRIARILPAFVTVVLATVVLAQFIYTPQDVASAGLALAAAALSVINLKFLFQGNYFAIPSDSQPYLHYWSLSVEEQFYLVFPLFFVAITRLGQRWRLWILGILWAASFLACVVVTRLKPEWAFYLLPTRAWELLAGSCLAVFAGGANRGSGLCLAPWVSTTCLATIIASFFLISEALNIPGFWPLLPVLGTVGVLFPQSGMARGSEKWLATPVLAFIGRLSYSLYLWHWPIFSLVDYSMYLAPEATRIVWKISLSSMAALASYALIENPARVWLNRPQFRPMAYGFLGGALALCTVLGITVRKENYISSNLGSVFKGGPLVFERPNATGCVVLIGDSYAPMYAKMMKEVCAELGKKLIVIGQLGGEPLPAPDGRHSPLWLVALATVEKEKPECVILACRWVKRGDTEWDRFALAVKALEPHAGRVVLPNQLPELPATATRAAMRQGVRPPFFEEPESRCRRQNVNALLSTLNSEKCTVIDVASHFEKENGELAFLDEEGRQLYHDSDHLSAFGVEAVRSDMVKAMIRGHSEHAVTPAQPSLFSNPARGPGRK